MKKKLRLGMVGGGQGAFIGAVHRLSARMDDKSAATSFIFDPVTNSVKCII